MCARVSTSYHLCPKTTSDGSSRRFRSPHNPRIPHSFTILQIESALQSQSESIMPSPAKFGTNSRPPKRLSPEHSSKNLHGRRDNTWLGPMTRNRTTAALTTMWRLRKAISSLPQRLSCSRARAILTQSRRHSGIIVSYVCGAVPRTIASSSPQRFRPTSAGRWQWSSHMPVLWKRSGTNALSS